MRMKQMSTSNKISGNFIFEINHTIYKCMWKKFATMNCDKKLAYILTGSPHFNLLIFRKHKSVSLVKCKHNFVQNFDVSSTMYAYETTSIGVYVLRLAS